MRDKPTIEVTGSYEEIKVMFRSVMDAIEDSMGRMTPEDAEKARFNYENNYRRSFTVELPREDED